MLTMTKEKAKAVPVKEDSDVKRLMSEREAAQRRLNELLDERVRCVKSANDMLVAEGERRAARRRLRELNDRAVGVDDSDPGEITVASDKVAALKERLEPEVERAQGAWLDFRAVKRRDLVRDLFSALDGAAEVARRLSAYDAETQTLGAGTLPYDAPVPFLVGEQVALENWRRIAREGGWLD